MAREASLMNQSMAAATLSPYRDVGFVRSNLRPQFGNLIQLGEGQQLDVVHRAEPHL